MYVYVCMYIPYGVTNDAHNSYSYEVIERKNYNKHENLIANYVAITK